MGDVPLAYVETVGGVRVSEDDVVVIGKNDVSGLLHYITLRLISLDPLLQGRTILNCISDKYCICQ
jgi:hypothetical protein